jgi:septum formation protein
MRKVILASTSKYRKELLLRLGIEFECHSPDLDEAPFKERIKNLQELAEVLSLEKARAVQKKFPDAIVIGSDQVAECNGRRLGKPITKEKAQSTLNFLNAKEHRLITSFTVLSVDNVYTRTNVTTLKMRALSAEQIERYIETDNPLDCAGSYKLELNGIGLFEKIDTDDHSAIVGLPLIELANLLNQIGICVPPKI